MSKTTPAIARRTLLGGMGATLATTGCYGSFNLTGAVYDWNGTFSSKWVRWLVFLGLCIVPVYGVVLFVDAFILNAIEFWTGEHPVSRTLEDGSTVAAEATEDPAVTRLVRRKDGRTISVFTCERIGDHEMVLRDARGRVLTRARSVGGGVELLDARGQLVARLDHEHCATLEADARARGSMTVALHERLAESGAGPRLAALGRELSSRAVL
jgi:hypothetical protein